MFTLPSGALCIVVGDVVGRGLPAAVAMGRLRSGLRAYALDTEDPAELLHRLDRQVRHFEPDVMATVLCAILEPSGEELRVSTAGHPPPVVSASPAAPAAVLDLPADQPVGVNAERPRHTTTMAVPPGTAVCLYTDGLIERRGRSLSVGLDHLRRAVVAGPAESVCSTVMSNLLGADPPTDDIAVLVVRRQDPADTDPLHLQMPATPASLKPIRTAIRRWLARVHADRGDTADVVAAVGEACANVVEHAYGPGGGTISVQLRIERPDIVAVIGDTGRWREPRGRDAGRGIILMHALTDDVQIERTQTGTRVLIRRTIADGRSR